MATTGTNALVLPAPAGGGEPNYEEGSVFFVGTATVIIRYAGFTILTDPNFLHMGDHVHLGYGLRSARRTDPAISFEELPPVDFVALSHLHEDHFDRLVAERLDKALPIVSTPHAAVGLAKLGFTAVHALHTWETLTVTRGAARLRLTALPGTHAPGPLAPLLPPVMGSMLEFGAPSGGIAFRLYISGDTLVHGRLREIPRRYPEIDLGLFHLGGTRVFGILLTMGARQGVEAIQIIGPRTAIPIHYNDYTVFKSSLEDFAKAVVAAGLESRVKYLTHGDTYTFTVPASRRQ